MLSEERSRNFNFSSLVDLAREEILLRHRGRRSGSDAIAILDPERIKQRTLQRTEAALAFAQATGCIDGSSAAEVDLRRLRVAVFNAKGFHQYLEASPSQDALAVSADGNRAVAAVCDGASYARASDIGARALAGCAADTALAMLRKRWSDPASAPFLSELYLRLYGSNWGFVAAAGVKPEQLLDHALPSTLLMAIITPSRSAVIAVGDGQILCNGRRFSVADCCRSGEALSYLNSPAHFALAMERDLDGSSEQLLAEAAWSADKEFRKAVLRYQGGKHKLSEAQQKDFIAELNARGVALAQSFSIVRSAPSAKLLGSRFAIESDGIPVPGAAAAGYQFPFQWVLSQFKATEAQDAVFFYHLAAAEQERHGLKGGVMKVGAPLLFLGQWLHEIRESPWRAELRAALPYSTQSVWERLSETPDIRAQYGVIKELRWKSRENCCITLAHAARTLLAKRLNSAELAVPFCPLDTLWDDMTSVVFSA